MRLARNSQIRAEGGIALWVIILALLGGAVWFLYSSRADAEKNARVFAREVAQKVAANYDEKYLHVRLSPKAQVTYLQSFRERLIQRLRDFGPMSQPIETKGKVYFSSYFFEPTGQFQAHLTYPTTTAVLELTISRGMTVWQIDEINLIWTPPPAPTPTPSPVMTPSPTPSPTPEQKPRRRKGRG